MILASFSCATARRTAPPLTVQEQFRVDIVSTRLWPETVERALRLVGNIEDEIILRKLALQVAGADPYLSSTPLGVRVFGEQTDSVKSRAQAIPQVVALPGNRIYISASLLKSLAYENELASLFAVEFNHLLARHAVTNRMQIQPGATGITEVNTTEEDTWTLSVPLLRGPGSVFRYTREQQEMAFRGAVRILYQAGYDPRGLVSYLRKRHNLEKDMPASLIKVLEQAAREEISRLPPLRNPIVSSADYVALMKRMNKK